MRFDSFSFGSIRIDGVTCDYDVVIDDGEIRKRKKKSLSNSATSLGILPYPSRRTYPGNAVGW
jgi:hypothetical protein